MLNSLNRGTPYFWRARVQEAIKLVHMNSVLPVELCARALPDYGWAVLQTPSINTSCLWGESRVWRCGSPYEDHALPHCDGKTSPATRLGPVPLRSVKPQKERAMPISLMMKSNIPNKGRP